MLALAQRAPGQPKIEEKHAHPPLRNFVKFIAKNPNFPPQDTLQTFLQVVGFLPRNMASSAQMVCCAQNFVSMEFEENKIADPKPPTDLKEKN